MKQLLFLSLFLLTTCVFGQDKIVFSGKVFDGETSQPLDFVQVSIKSIDSSTYTKADGSFQMTLPKGEYIVDFSLVDYKDFSQKIKLSADKNENFYLQKSDFQQLGTVTINASKNENVKSSKIGVIKMDIKEIKTLPAFMGEVDLIKAIQTMPGVSSVSEGSQGFYVRGGGPDENLVLLDGAQIYNASHLFGFFSVFNVDAVSGLELSKGGMTADFGGRLSSLLQITQKDGDLNKYHVNGGIGIISSRLEVDGPIQKGKSSFMISGRRTYIDILMKPFLKKKDFGGLGYYFYDVNARLNFRLSSKDRLFISSYIGEDRFKYQDKEEGMNMRLPWGNKMAIIRWNHVINQKNFFNISAFYTQYDIQMAAEVDNFSVTMGTGIRDFGGRAEFTWLPNIRHRIRYGVDYTFHTFTPASVSAFQDETTFDTGRQQRLNAHESAIFIADDWDITEKWRLNFGLRYSMYEFVGPFDRYVKIPMHDDSITHYGRGKLIKFDSGLEPRISTRIMLGKNNSLKGGFSVNYQYVHLASLTAVSFPSDLWVPTTEKIKPEMGWQSTVGYFHNFLDGMFETSVEVYYKQMYNLVDFANGSKPQDNVNDNVDNQLVNGRGWSYGAEFFIKKAKGKFTGWIGYTISRSMRLFPQIQPTAFPAKYDRTHDLDVVLNYKINDRWSVSANFVFATGNTLTMPSSWYIYDQDVIMEYGSRNSTRMPNYHRLDLSATWKDKPYKTKMIDGKEQQVKKRFRNSVSFSIYNVYNRANPYFLYLSVHGDLSSSDFKVRVKQVSLFPILPSVTWNFEF